MRIVATLVCWISFQSIASALPKELDISYTRSGPHVETSHRESPSLVTPQPPASPANSTLNPNDKGFAPSNESSPILSSSPNDISEPNAVPAPDTEPQAESSLSDAVSQSKPGRLASGLGLAGDVTVQSQPAGAESVPKPAALDVGQRQETRDSKASPTSAVYEIPEANEPQPKASETAPGVPMAMVHSEAALDGPHTMQPGDSILTAGVDPFASNLIFSMNAPATTRIFTTKASPAVQGATFAAGGATYTASVDQNFNIVVGSSVIKPGGAAVTLGGGAARISVIPGGALVVDGGTLTMSALRPLVTGCAVSLNGRLVTARVTGTGGNLMVVGTATLTSLGPAATISGEVISFGKAGLYHGPLVAAISTMTPSYPAPLPTLSGDRVSGLARMSQASSSARPSVTYITVGSGASTNQLTWESRLLPLLAVMLGGFFVG